MLEKVSGIKLVVAEELPDTPVELVSTLLQSCVEHRSTRTAVFCAKVCRLDSKFLNCIHRRKHDVVRAIEEVNGVGVVVNSVEHVIVLGGTETVGGERTRGCVTTGIGLRRVHALH